MKRKVEIEQLVALYFGEGLSLDKASVRCGLAASNIRQRLVAAGYALRPPMTNGWLNPDHSASRVPTHADVAWAAGVYEGEGAVLTPKSKYGTRKPVVSLVQKDDWLCNELRAIFGGTVRVYAKPDGRKFNYWRLTGARAIAFLLVIYKFLSPRRQQQIQNAYNPVIAAV